MTLFVTSDLHFGHKNIIEYCNRPFPCLKDMNAGLIEIWNSKVGPEDTVYHLGDLSFDRDHSKKDGPLFELLTRLNGHKVFVLGNHDRHISSKLKQLAHGRFPLPKVQSVHDYLEVDVNGTKVVMFHYPCAEWHGSHRGSVMLHGHCHGNRQDLPGRILDVGIDAHPNFTIWTMEEALAAANQRFEETKSQLDVGHYKEV